MKKFTAAIAGCLFALCSYAQINMQYVISSLGTSSTAWGAVSSTAGELSLVTTFFGGAHYITQGFQQPNPYNLFFQPVTSLPVTLTDFSGRGEDGVNHLVWHTASEIDNDHFEIEKYENENREFRSIGTRKGAGTTSAMHAYGFDDNNVKSGTSYYRLKQVDVDGHFTYSQIVSISAASKAGSITTSVFPNPFHNRLNIALNSTAAQQVEITITDFTGHSVYKESVLLEAGSSLQEMPFETFASGPYLVRINTVGDNQVYKIFKD